MAFPPRHSTTPNEPRPKGGEDQAHGLGGRTEEVLRFRDEHGGFETWADFDEIPISTQELDGLRPQVQL
jgi:hypothetical protein